MPFTFKQENDKSAFKRTERFIQTPGQHIIRALDTQATEIDVHIVKRAKFYTIKCLGAECPICETNKKIFVERKDEFRKDPNYIPRSRRHFFNVLDRTPVKVCSNPECQAEVKAEDMKNFPSACPMCKSMIVGAEPTISNKVKIFEVSEEVAHGIDLLERSELDEAGNPIGWNNYDMMVLKQREKSPVFKVLSKNNDVVSVPADALFDVKESVISLTPDEIKDVLRGVTIKDIYAARKAESGMVASNESVQQIAEATLADIKEDLANNLFKM
jgi:hypothetical protein